MRAAQITWHTLHSQGNRFIVALASKIFSDALNIDAVLEQFRKLNTIYPCDQWIYVYPLSIEPFWAIQFWNSDGSRALACGNGTRCAAHLLHQLKLGDASLSIKGPVGLLHAVVSPKTSTHAEVTVFQGAGKLLLTQKIQHTFCPHAWQFLCDHTAYMQAVDMGNLHLVLLGPDDPIHIIQTYHKLFGERYISHPPKAHIFSGNISYVRVNPATQEADVATWENGVGPTQACGSAACAALVTMRSQNGRFALTLHFPGGIIETYDDEGCWHSANSYYVQQHVA